MNCKFERQLLQPLLESKKIVYQDRLESLRGMKLAIDANVLLAIASSGANPLKFIQEGGASVDFHLQCKIRSIIVDLKYEYGISLVVILDGLVPKAVVDNQQNTLRKSKQIWDKIEKGVEYDDKKKKDLFFTLLEVYGSRCFYTEVVNACVETDTEFLVAPYFSQPQLQYLYNEQLVHAVVGSPLGLLSDGASNTL